MLELARLLEIPLAVFESSSVDYVGDNNRDEVEFFDVAAFIIDTNSVKETKEASFELVGFDTFEINADLLFNLPVDNEDFDTSGSEAIVDQVYSLIHKIPNYLTINLITDRVIFHEVDGEEMIGYNSTWEFTYPVETFQDSSSLKLHWDQIHFRWNELKQKWENS